MDKEMQKKIRADIDSSTIPNELKLLYLMSDATETLSRQIFMRLKGIYAKRGYKVHENDMLTGINDYCKYIKRATYQFFERIDPHIVGATWDVERKVGNSIEEATDTLDEFHGDANEIVRLVMLYIDRVSRSNDGFSRIFKTLRQMPSLGVFNDEDITKYKMKGK